MRVFCVYVCMRVVHSVKQSTTEDEDEFLALDDTVEMDDGDQDESKT